MIVTGGTYLESCRFPQYQELWGSAFRGAAAISEVSEGSDELVTCIGASERVTLDTNANAFGLEYTAEDIPKSVHFSYLHSLSTPSFSPVEAASYDRTLGPIEEECILRYDLIEGTTVVKGDRVVYDPQSAEPESFYNNGSEAEQLALVLNQPEARFMSGTESTEEMLDELSTGHRSAEVVVLKCGASGALVRVQDETHRIPAFKTDRVWPIGSGDVFSAIFATYWAEQELPPQKAAYEASLATAYYCSTEVLPVPSDPYSDEGFEADELTPELKGGKPSVYLAAPFFSLGQFWLVEEVREILIDRDVEVFSPYHDVGYVGTRYNKEEVAQRDLEAIDQCDVVFALLDGDDRGTDFEIGYARKADKPAIAYEHEPERSRNTMVEGSGCAIYGELPSAVYNLLWLNE